MSINVSVDHENQLIVARCDNQELAPALLHDYLRVWDEDVLCYDELFILTEADLSKLAFMDLLGQAKEAVQLDASFPQSRNAIVVKDDMGEKLAQFFNSAKKMASAQCREAECFSMKQ